MSELSCILEVVRKVLSFLPFEDNSHLLSLKMALAEDAASVLEEFVQNGKEIFKKHLQAALISFSCQSSR